MTCSATGKVGHSKDAARRVLGRMKLELRAVEDRDSLTTYRCKACRKWHVGHRGWSRAPVEGTTAGLIRERKR